MKKLLSTLLLVTFLISSVILTGCTNTPAKTNAELYKEAVLDAVLVEESDICPLVNITKDDPNVIWNEAGDRILLFTFHKYPSSYPDGAEVSNSWGFVWTSSLKELQNYYDKNKSTVSDWKLRLIQMMGMPEDTKNSHITAFWIKPEDIVRPAFVTDITAPMATSFPDGTPEEHIEWFKDNFFNSFSTSLFPWTGLGYTYDWADNGTVYGLSEFIILANSDIQVEYTVTVEEFFENLGK